MDFQFSDSGFTLILCMLLLDIIMQIFGGASYLKYWTRLTAIYQTRAAIDSDERRRPPLVSVVIAAYNEEDVIEKTTLALLKNDYRAFEIIIVDDGSTDRTFSILSSMSNLHDIRVIRNKTNLGKCRSIEVGIESSAGQIICLIDADTVVCQQFLSEIIQPILTDEADAICGNIKVGNKTNALTHFQSIEYISILSRIRAIQDISGFITTMPGAASAFKKSVLASVGGYSSGSLAEDADFTIRLSLKNKRIRFTPKATAYTEVPSSWKSLFFQRRRWVFGNIQCLFWHIAECS
jgi:cellulose synthase/poly-beta-1,6-N-acetylglucosamine synthase-like glycosyltransferase